MTSFVLAFAGGVLLTDRPSRVWMPSTAALVLVSPLLAAAGWAAVGLLVAARRLRSSRIQGEQLETDVTLFAELVGLGVSSGLTIAEAFRLGMPFVGEELRAEVGGLERRSRTRGLATVLIEAEGHGRELYRTVARSASTGAPLGQALQAFVTERGRERHAAELEAMKRLPLRLMVPIALLILPGFVLLSLGPAIVASLERLIIE